MDNSSEDGLCKFTAVWLIAGAIFSQVWRLRAKFLSFFFSFFLFFFLFLNNRKTRIGDNKIFPQLFTLI